MLVLESGHLVSTGVYTVLVLESGHFSNNGQVSVLRGSTVALNTLRAHRKWVGLFPADGDPPGGLPLLQGLRHHEDDEHEVEDCNHGGQDDHLHVPMCAGQVYDVRP